MSNPAHDRDLVCSQDWERGAFQTRRVGLIRNQGKSPASEYNLEMMTTYTAIASRGEKYWLVRVPGLGAYPEEGLPTQARTLADVEPWARDLIATYLDVPPDSFTVEVRTEVS